MRKPLFFALLLGVIFIIPLFFSHPLLAQSDAELEKQFLEKQDQIKQLETQLAATKEQEKTLKSQLDFIDNQTKLAELRIDQTQYQIIKLNKEIIDLGTRIDRLSKNVDSISAILINRIVKTYKYGGYSAVDLFFSSNGFSDLLERLKYIEVAQANDKKVLYQLQATKNAYNDQKQDKQQRQTEAEKLKQDLEKYQKQLDDQKQAKAELLKITQNDEAVYEAKIRTAQQEQNAILAILNGGGNEVAEGSVKANDIIGRVIQGRSACSSGTHLHFEVHQNGSIQDPNNYLSNHDYIYSDNDGGASEGSISPHGPWNNWPLFDIIYITQGYGMTPYAKAGAYSGSPHTGIDMYSSSGLSVKAVRDGTLSRGGIACGGGTLNYKKVDQGDGTSAYYLHVL